MYLQENVYEIKEKILSYIPDNSRNLLQKSDIEVDVSKTVFTCI